MTDVEFCIIPKLNESVMSQDTITETPINIIAKKKVRFPEDEKIVSDYFVVKEYWNQSRFCSSEELISAYKKSCEKYSTKPIPIVLEQIKGIDVNLCHDRYDMLNVVNVKLDLKGVECLEEIFKRVQFKTLIFESCNLDDECASSLFEMIEFYETCNKLNISYNSKIGYSGFNSLSKMLKKTPCIDTLEMKGIMFTDTTVPPLNRALRCGSHLRVLHLEYSNICSKNLLILSSALKLNVFIKELHLSGNRLVPSDGIQLGSLLKINRYLELLDVRNNALGDVGLSHICDGLCHQFLPGALPSNADQADDNTTSAPSNSSGLLCLFLCGNSITYNGMHSLSETLKIHRAIQSLNLGNNPLSSEGVHILKDGLLVNKSLIRLSLPCCKITCEGGVAIAEYLADTRQLMRLDLRENDIKTAGLMAISLSMRVNKTITRLDIDSNPKRDGGVKGYSETQVESLKTIQERVGENKKRIIQQQELELTQSIQSLSNSFENFQQNNGSFYSNETQEFLQQDTDENNKEITDLDGLDSEEVNPSELHINNNNTDQDDDVDESPCGQSLTDSSVLPLDLFNDMDDDISCLNETSDKSNPSEEEESDPSANSIAKAMVVDFNEADDADDAPNQFSDKIQSPTDTLLDLEELHQQIDQLESIDPTGTTKEQIYVELSAKHTESFADKNNNHNQ